MEIATKQLGKIIIQSVAGIGTTIVLPGQDLSIDMGFCTRPAIRTSRVAITHTHADHVAGIHSYLGTRRLYGMGPSIFYCPSESCTQFVEFLTALDGLQKKPFRWSVEKSGMDFRTQLKTGYYLQAFPTTHSVPSNGYAVLYRRIKLKEEFQKLSGTMIAAKRANNEMEIFETKEDVLLAVTGDTTLTGILHNPMVEKAGTLVIETTFLDQRKDIPKAHLGNHIHLDELIPLLEQWTQGANPKHVILYHVSQIYRPNETVEIINKKLSDHAKKMVTIVPPEWSNNYE